jgi:hypothetical protein
MAEVQDMPRRRLFLNVKAVVVRGRKPGIMGALNMFGFGGGSKPAVGGSDTVGVQVSSGRAFRGLELLARYVYACFTHAMRLPAPHLSRPVCYTTTLILATLSSRAPSPLSPQSQIRGLCKVPHPRQHPASPIGGR